MGRNSKYESESSPSPRRRRRRCSDDSDDSRGGSRRKHRRVRSESSSDSEEERRRKRRRRREKERRKRDDSGSRESDEEGIENMRKRVSASKDQSLTARTERHKEDIAARDFTPAPVPSRRDSDLSVSRSRSVSVATAAGSESPVAESSAMAQRQRSTSRATDRQTNIGSSGTGFKQDRVASQPMTGTSGIPAYPQEALLSALAFDVNHGLPPADLVSMLTGLDTVSNARNAACSIGEMQLSLVREMGRIMKALMGDVEDEKEAAKKTAPTLFGVLAWVDEQFGLQSKAVTRLAQADVIVAELKGLIG